MSVNKLLIGLLMFLFLGSSGQAQDRFAVFYKFKPQENLSLDDPETFLTEKALLRRLREAVPVDSTDLPVSPKYVEAVQEEAVAILYHTKWLNASVVVLEQDQIEPISSLPFVERVELIGYGYNPPPLNERTSLGSMLNAKFSFNTERRKAARMLKSMEFPTDFQNELLGINLMHEEGFKGAGVTVAVFDAGYPGVNTSSALGHLVDNNQIVGSIDVVRPWNDNVFIDNQHGTNVLSVIASNDPEKFIAGAPDANYILAITEEVATEYRIEEFNWLRAAEYADSLGADIINGSLGYNNFFDDPNMNYTAEQIDGKTAIVTQAANFASEKGILVVASSGNEGPGERSISPPADSPMALSIGSLNQDLEPSSFSSRGPTADDRIKPDLVTFGNGTAIIRSNDNVGFASGTSFSAPQITALAAGLWEARPEWTRAQLVENLLRSATNSDDPDTIIGYGIPNFWDAYYGEILDVEDEKEELIWKVYPNPLYGDELLLEYSSGLIYEFELLDMSGKIILKTEVQREDSKIPFRVDFSSVNPGLYIIQIQDSKSIKRTKLFRY
ncbi:S8 family serine peptidase [Algoriphagus hitonicola]|uniref:Por secretion system C-terminal sorting domain-containing protein n=1 Tax=Algoriphagus hitonicola TaxID=435880 RepID=A0A1I2XBR3_9BACT|nr:S8 family serine peptidase [Algoriphagus hitonicola]SFH10477.1 Por secretion system C-terminal sorting domain-containing protein [Algoriphagus hitonicola]